MSKSVSVLYTASARKDLQKLDKEVSRRIVTTIERYTKVDPLRMAKQLKGIFQGLYRYRIGDYRAVFEYDDKGNLVIVKILIIKHRSKVYGG